MNAMAMSQLTKMKFRTSFVKMPHKFEKPQDSQQYGEAFSPIEKFGIPNPMGLYIPTSMAGDG